MLPGRTTPTLVAGIIEWDNIDVPDLTPFIDIANELVTERCAITSGTPPVNIYGYTDYRLELIERWLAAHFYAVRDPRATQEGVGPLTENYQSRVDLGLNSSTYGQQVMRLDTSGSLAILNNAANKYAKVPVAILTGVKIGVTALGIPYRPRRWWWD